MDCYRILGVAVLAASLVFGADAAMAQGSSSYSMAISDSFVSLDDGTTTVDLSFTLDEVSIRGWSIGVCHDADIVEISSVEPTALIDTLNGGAEPLFQAINTFAGSGLTIGVVVSSGLDALGPGEDLVAYELSYSLLATGSATLTFCEGLGFPEVEIYFADANGDLVEPLLADGLIAVPEEPPPFGFGLDVPNPVGYDPEVGEVEFTVNATIREFDSSDTFPSDTLGFSMGLAHDSAVLEVVDAARAGVLVDMNGGAGAEFFGFELGASGTGVTLGVVYNLMGSVQVEFDDEEAVAAFTYRVLPGLLAGDLDGDDTRLIWSDELGNPQIPNTVVVGSDSLPVETVNEDVFFVPVVDLPFLRGDCNADAEINIADGVFILNDLFEDAESGPCAAACDVNGDEDYNQSDAIFTFNYQFLDGPEPPAPFPDCGIVPGADCVAYDGCP